MKIFRLTLTLLIDFLSIDVPTLLKEICIDLADVISYSEILFSDWAS